jgi:hypothetical protein
VPVHSPPLRIRDESSLLAARSFLNFTGAGVTATDDAASNETDVTIPGGGGGGASATTVEVNLGTTATWQGRFTITDAAIGTSSKVLVWQAPGPYTGKGTLADEAEMDRISCVCEPLAGTARVMWSTEPMITSGYALPNGPREVQARTPMLQTFALRIGKVKGNVKFSYVVFA